MLNSMRTHLMGTCSSAKSKCATSFDAAASSGGCCGGGAEPAAVDANEEEGAVGAVPVCLGNGEGNG